MKKKQKKIILRVWVKLVIIAVIMAGIFIGGKSWINMVARPVVEETTETIIVTEEILSPTKKIESYTLYGNQFLLNYEQNQGNLMSIEMEEQVYVAEMGYYYLKDTTTGEQFSFPKDAINANGISFEDISDGSFLLYEKDGTYDYLLTSDTADTLLFHTVRVNGFAKEVTIDLSAEKITMEVETVASDSFADADIVIDPGHGDIEDSEQPGACSDVADTTFWESSCEREVMLQISEYVKQRLENHDLVIEMTRTEATEKYDPSGDYTNSTYERTDVENSKADEVSKTTVVLNSKAKLSLSMHFNMSEASNADLDIYQSQFIPNTNVISTTSFVGSELAKSLDENNGGDTYLLSRDYCYEYEVALEDENCQAGVNDYYYPIREFGGNFTNALYYDNDLVYNEVNTSPEALLLELFNGANELEILKYQEELQTPTSDGNLETMIQTIVEYYGIVYDELEG